MIPQWFGSLISGPKLWRIGDHRVKSVFVPIKKKTKRYSPMSNSMEPTTKRVTQGRYECVDCEKQFEDREEFKDEECFEVIE